MRSSSAKLQNQENNRVISGRLDIIHKRLLHALGLGTRSYDDGRWKWCSTDVETQKLVIGSIDAFLDCISSESRETSQHPLVKETVAYMIEALGTTLLYKNESVLMLASKVTFKMINTLRHSMTEAHILSLIRPISSLLSSHQLVVTVSCAAAMNLALPLLITREKEVWEVLTETDTVNSIIGAIREFSGGPMAIEFIIQMVSLLHKILLIWPPSRFCVWNDSKLMEVLGAFSLEPIPSVKAAILQLYSAIALCADGSKKLLENEEPIFQLMVQCMDSSKPHFLRIKAFALAKCFVMSEHGRLKMMGMHCEPLIKAIISGLSNWSPDSRKVGKDQMSLIMNACHFAMITQWTGQHHNYFWELGIGSVLLKLLIGDFHEKQDFQQGSTVKELITMAEKILSASPAFVWLELRQYIWHILGGLAANFAEDLITKKLRDELHLDLLIACACLTFANSPTYGQTDSYGNQSACRAVVLMIYSPSKYIASKARSIVSELLKPKGKGHIKCLLNDLVDLTSGEEKRVPTYLHIDVNLITLACFSGLPQYRRQVLKNQGITILFSFIKWCLKNPIHVKSLNMTQHLLHMKACCYDCEEEWEGTEMVLLFGLWALAELMQHSTKDHIDRYARDIGSTEAQMVIELHDICMNSGATGPRWFAAYILSYFGFYGFPSKLGIRISKALKDQEYMNLMLNIADRENLNVHGVMFSVRCPALLPLGNLVLNEKTLSSTLGKRCLEMHHWPITEVRLSAHVDHQALLKLLEYVYSGHLWAKEELVKKLRHLAKQCKLQPLLQMLCRHRPKWGTPTPTFDLTSALGPAGYHFSDIILEPKANELDHWTCTVCEVSTPHVHAHRVILCSCDYMQAMLNSGMQESQSKTIKLSVGWKALVKLVNWFYSGKLPKVKFGCGWNNLSAEEKLDELESYMELYCLCDMWLLKDLREDCSSLITCCLDTARNLAIKVIKLAADSFQWEMVEIAANYMAPLYHQLRNTDEFEELDDDLIKLVRVKSVKLFQEASASQYS